MVLGIVLLIIVCTLGVAAVFMARRRQWTHGLFAWRVAQAATLSFILSVAVYEKPASFYTNFVIVPAIICFLFGLLLVVCTLVLGLLALVRQQDGRKGLAASALALIAAVACLAIISWRAR